MRLMPRYVIPFLFLFFSFLGGYSHEYVKPGNAHAYKIVKKSVYIAEFDTFQPQNTTSPPLPNAGHKGTFYSFWPFSVCCFKRNLVPWEYQPRYRFRPKKKLNFLFLILLFKHAHCEWRRLGLFKTVKTAGYFAICNTWGVFIISETEDFCYRYFCVERRFSTMSF